eukprot:1660018-Prymnesium_polylepis.1
MGGQARRRRRLPHLWGAGGACAHGRKGEVALVHACGLRRAGTAAHTARAPARALAGAMCADWCEPSTTAEHCDLGGCVGCTPCAGRALPPPPPRREGGGR